MTAPARPQAPPIGLYSIRVRGLAVERLLRWSAGHRIPFVHLRSGPRGHDVAGWNRVRAERVRAVSQATVPITLVTADLDLIHLLRGANRAPAEARSALSRLAETAALIGAGAVRLLATERPDLAALDAMDVPGAAVPVLIELHDPGWLRPTAMTALKRLLGRWPRSGLLLGGTRIEVAFEWTGADRSPTACLDRYRAAGAWWASVWTSAVEGRAGRGASLQGAPVGTRP